MAEETMTTSTSGGNVACKTKLVQWFGRSTPIILEKETGSSIPIAICNYLLLRGHASRPVTRVIQESQIISIVRQELARNFNNSPLENVMKRLLALELTSDGGSVRFCANLLNAGSRIPTCLEEEEAKEDELCVLFGKYQFCTLIKHNGEMYRLVTDHAYEYEPGFVWENLKEVNGLRVFKSGDFQRTTAVPR